MPFPLRAIFDAHLHIIDPRFPLVANGGYLPPAFDCGNYLQRMRDYPLVGGAIVSGSFQAFDQSYLLDALEQLGPGFAGVTQLPVNTTDDELLALNAAGVRAIRFNLRRGGSENIDHLERMALRVHELAGWHTELYVDGRDLVGLFETIRALPAVSIDHLGLSWAGFKTLLKLAEQGVHVKATGFGRLDFDPVPALRDIYAVNPEALMFGTDLPSTRAPRPFADTDARLVIEALGPRAAQRVLHDNAIRFYRLAA